MAARRVPVPLNFRKRLEEARLDSIALFRALDRADLAAADIPQRLLHRLYELDADCAEALLCMDQPPRRSLNVAAMVRDTLATLARLPSTRATLRSKLPPGVQARLHHLETTIRTALDPREAYNDIPGRDPQVRYAPFAVLRVATRAAFAIDSALRSWPGSSMVEQETLNLWVEGSSPSRVTIP